VVSDVQKFIAAQLRELDARLNGTRFAGGFGIPTIVDWLAQCGVELELLPLREDGERGVTR
jgi:hypothetical protein